MENPVMKAAPLVSVVVPCLNRAHFLRPTIDSILNQSYPRIECIVVDGGSTDNTVDILKEYGSRINWVSGPDRGHADAINKGWKLSKGEILAWLNADDVWEVPGSVTQVVDYFRRHPETDVVYGNSGAIDETGRSIGMAQLHEWDLAYAVEFCDYCIPQAATFIRRTIAERVGWLDISFVSKKDHEFWVRLGRVGKFSYMPVMLASTRACPGYLANRGDITARACVALTKKFYRQPGLPFDFLAKKRRAMSNAYLRGMEYSWAHGRKWGTVFYYAFRAPLADWSNRWRVIEILQYYLDESSKEHRGWRFISRLFALLIGFWSRVRRMALVHRSQKNYE
jgi:glycosyltransferase involved in cell wall biosynthesis